MTTRYHLRDDGYPFRWIIRGRKKVGRVFFHLNGDYVGLLHRKAGERNAVARGDTWDAAMANVVAAARTDTAVTIVPTPKAKQPEAEQLTIWQHRYSSTTQRREFDHKADRLYIAYGSNLNKRAMRTRCPDAKAEGNIVLDNAQLVFRGVADVEPIEGKMVPAGLWRISESDEATLDRYEGVSSGMYRKVWITLDNGSRALLYLMNSKGVYPPTAGYVQCIREGYRGFGLDDSYLDEAIRRSYDKRETPETKLRRLRQKQRGDLKLATA